MTADLWWICDLCFQKGGRWHLQFCIDFAGHRHNSAVNLAITVRCIQFIFTLLQFVMNRRWSCSYTFNAAAVMDRCRCKTTLWLQQLSVVAVLWTTAGRWQPSLAISQHMCHVTVTAKGRGRSRSAAEHAGFCHPWMPWLWQNIDLDFSVP